MFLKQVDILRRLNSTVELDRPSSLLSLAGVLLVLLLSYRLVLDFRLGRYQSDLNLSSAGSAKIVMNLQMLIRERPCTALNMTWTNAQHKVAKQIELDNLLLNTLDNKGELVKTSLSREDLQIKSISWMQKNYSCYLKGKIQFPAVPGMVTISTDKHVLDHTDKQLRVSYQLKDLFFGSKKFEDKAFHQRKEQEYFDSISRKEGSVQDFQAPLDYSVLNQILVFPVEVVQKNSVIHRYFKFNIKSSQYPSQNYKAQLYFKIHQSPVTVRHKQHRNPLLHLLVQILAVVGGVFSSLTLVDWAVSKIPLRM